jgi:hypothetical protein
MPAHGFPAGDHRSRSIEEHTRLLARWEAESGHPPACPGRSAAR